MYFIAFLPLGINLLTSYYFQAVMRPKESLVISFMRNIILSSAGILLFPIIIGANALWYVIPVVEVLTLIVSMIFLAVARKKSQR